ncbi:MAG: HEPN domain-containing protein [Prevotella sp.]|nr:HEPN domain-containing protein [Prevotella sp.]
MAKEDVVKKWLDIVGQDIEVAILNHNNGYWLYAAFLCHQALEKALKAYWVGTHEEDPPFTHSHTRLLNGCGLIDKLSDEQLRFITLIEPMYIEARYPEQKLDVAKMLNKESSQYILTKTKELIQWIENLLSVSMRP